MFVITSWTTFDNLVSACFSLAELSGNYQNFGPVLDQHRPCWHKGRGRMCRTWSCQSRTSLWICRGIPGKDSCPAWRTKTVTHKIPKASLLCNWKRPLPPIHIYIPLFGVQLHVETMILLEALNTQLEFLYHLGDFTLVMNDRFYKCLILQLILVRMLT